MIFEDFDRDSRGITGNTSRVQQPEAINPAKERAEDMAKVKLI